MFICLERITGANFACELDVPKIGTAYIYVVDR